MFKEKNNKNTASAGVNLKELLQIEMLKEDSTLIKTTLLDFFTAWVSSETEYYPHQKQEMVLHFQVMWDLMTVLETKKKEARQNG